MPQNKTKIKRSKRVEAIILIADIENSSHIAETTPEREYNNMLRDFHRIASRAIDTYLPRIFSDSIVTKRAFGDEILLIMQPKDIVFTLSKVLSLAVFLEVEWSKSRFNTKRMREYKRPCRLRVGVGHGLVTLAESVWEQGMTPEGYAIATAKRIESFAGGALHEPHIMVAGSLRPILEKVEGIEIGHSILIPENKTKGIKAIEVIRLKAYEGLYREFKKSIRIMDKYDKWFTRGYQAYSAGDYDEAIKCYRRATDSRTNSPNALSYLGGVLTIKGKLDEAEIILRESLKMKPDSTKTMNNLGSILNRKKKYREAEQIFKKLVIKDPSRDIYFYNLGCALERQNKLEEASIAFEKAIVLNPGYVTALGNLAEIRLEQDRFVESEMLLKRALKIDPDNPDLIEVVEQVNKARKAKALD
ncbi:MAG: tetratricopeptide repeat protein [Calditrichaeota bacterium]|nr:tetratricopeptide repeat protein [Calditrichota bacterium]